VKTKRTAQHKPPKECRECSRWVQLKEKIRVTELLASTIRKMEERLKADDFKPSIADYLKLVQLEQELDRDEAKEIKVTWVEPEPTSQER
jgi:hypothetical protein